MVEFFLLIQCELSGNKSIGIAD